MTDRAENGQMTKREDVAFVDRCLCVIARERLIRKSLPHVAVAAVPLERRGTPPR